MTLNVTGVDDAPVARDDILEVTSASSLSILANDTDVDADPVTVSIQGTVFGGTATVNADRTVTVAVPAGFKGVTRFRYRITDAGGATSDASALAFVGIRPFKAIYLSPPDGATPAGIYMHDLISATLVHEPTFNWQNITNIWYPRDARGMAFQYNNPNTGRLEIRYVDLRSPGTSRLVHAPLTATQNATAFTLSLDGRYVSYIYTDSAVSLSGSELYLFDAELAGTGRKVSLPANATVGAARFNEDSTHLAYIGRAATNYPSLSAAYRVDLATGVATRASPEVETASDDVPFLAPDASRLILQRRLTNGQRLLYVSNPSQPDIQQLMLEPQAADENTFAPQMVSRAATRFITAIVDDSSQQRRFVLGRPLTPGTSDVVGGLGFGAVNVMGQRAFSPDETSVLVTKSVSGVFTLFEVPFAQPDNLVPVAQVPSPRQYVNAGYSSDGTRISYLNRVFNGTQAHIEVVRRGDYLNPVEVTPVSGNVVNWFADASGTVGAYNLELGPGDHELRLVNVDAPQNTIALGRLPFSTDGLFSLVLR